MHSCLKVTSPDNCKPSPAWSLWEMLLDVDSCILYHLSLLERCKLLNPRKGEKVNSMWPGDSICCHRPVSIIAQVMTCCRAAPSHHLNQYWFIIKKVLWHPSNGSIHWKYWRYHSPTDLKKNSHLKPQPHLPADKGLSWHVSMSADGIHTNNCDWLSRYSIPYTEKGNSFFRCKFIF